MGRGGEGWGASVLTGLAVVILLFLLMPLAGMLLRTPWSTAWDTLGSDAIRTALWLSLIVSGLSVLLSLLFGFPLAWVLARRSFPGKTVVRTLVTLPMVLPPVVAGVALLAALGRKGLLGGALTALGIGLPFSMAGAVLAACFVSSPFLVLSLEAGISSVDRRLEDAAATLGATRWTIIRRVVLPAIRPSLLSGMALTWARALGEFGATITFAGNLRGRTQTLPLAVYEVLQTDYEGAILVSLLLVAVSVVILVALRGRVFAR